jgi:hypothetical protein
MTTMNIYDMADTWNAGATTFTAIKMNVTDTGSAAGSLLMDLQVGGVSQSNIDKTGILFVRSDINIGASNQVSLRASDSSLRFLSDTILLRDTNDTLAQRRGTNAQAFRVYNTFTDASNYERGFVRFNSNVFEIRSEAAGTGTARMVRIQAGSSAGIELETNGRTTLTGNNGVSFANNALFFASNTPDRIRIVNGAQSAGTALELQEMTAPGAPAANFVRIYAVDNGSGKTQLMAQFATGAAVQIAIEP